jgi:ZIP family zinc transporter
MSACPVTPFTTVTTTTITSFLSGLPSHVSFSISLWNKAPDGLFRLHSKCIAHHKSEHYAHTRMSGIWQAGFWGFVGGASLLIGAVIGVYGRASQRVIAWVMALGAGVLISSVAFELMNEAFRNGGFDAASIGLAAGALCYYAADLLVSKAGAAHRKRSSGKQADGSGMAITIGALMDGIPESVAIGVSLIGGGRVGVAMVVAVFLSNIPEGLSAAVGLKKAGHSALMIMGMWTAVVIISALASMAGYAFLAGASGDVLAAIQSFAAGAILTMLASTMMPEAFAQGGATVGVVTTFGFLAAFVLSKLEH